jgi:hypothetical protein
MTVVLRHLPFVIAATRTMPKKIVPRRTMRGVGAGGYTPQAGNLLVSSVDADAACTGSFTTPSSWPPSMTQEAKNVLSSGAGTQFIYCGDDKNLYQVNGNGTLQRCTALDPDYNPDAVPPPTGTTCPAGYTYDPASGQCVSAGNPDVTPVSLNTPGTSTSSSSSSSSSTPLIVGGVLVVAAIAVGLAYMAHSSSTTTTTHSTRYLPRRARRR